MRLKIGDKVKVYQDPVTKTDFEGIATLLELTRHNPYSFFGDRFYPTWKVEFEDGDIMLRIIDPHDKQYLQALGLVK